MSEVFEAKSMLQTDIPVSCNKRPHSCMFNNKKPLMRLETGNSTMGCQYSHENEVYNFAARSEDGVVRKDAERLNAAEVA